MTLSSMDIWRLADDLTVLQAAVLISGSDPSELLAGPSWILADLKRQHSKHKRALAAREAASIDISTFTNESLSEDPRKTMERAEKLMASIQQMSDARAGMDRLIRPAFEALISALMNDRLNAIFVFDAGDGERQFKGAYSELLALQESVAPNRYEPDWDKTTIAVRDLKEWLAERGVLPEFFFPNRAADSFENDENPRYSAELACAVAAWKAYESNLPNKSVKATLKTRIEANAVRFGVETDRGVPLKTAVDRVATLVNWEKGGCVPPTASTEQQQRT